MIETIIFAIGFPFAFIIALLGLSLDEEALSHNRIAIDIKDPVVNIIGVFCSLLIASMWPLCLVPVVLFIIGYLLKPFFISIFYTPFLNLVEYINSLEIEIKKGE